jgi:signal transduction histidine kinase
MDSLIGAILRISREGRRAFKLERINTTELVQQLADSIRYQTDAGGSAIEVKPLPEIVSDRLAIQQIFGNLLDNAIKYLDPNRPGRISVSASEGDGRFFFLVRDNGRGIAEKDLGRVFELFRRAGTQDKPGEGIGLAHVRTLVRALGGRIEVTSRLGVGTTFTVILPRTSRPLAEEA